MVNQLKDAGYLQNLFYQKKINSFAEVTASESYYYIDGKQYSHNSVENLINWSCDHLYRYFSNSTEKPYIMYEFKQNIPKFFEYSFETHGDTAAQSFPNQWIVKGSNANSNENEWEILDERKTTILESLSRQAIFHMKPCQYKYIKFIQLNNTYNSSQITYKNTFSLRHIDFYTIQQCTINCNKYIRIHHLFYIAIFL